MDCNLSMQNNIANEEPAQFFQRVYKLNRRDASKNESTYMKLIECGAKISMNDYMTLIGKTIKIKKPFDISSIQVLHSNKKIAMCTSTRACLFKGCVKYCRTNNSKCEHSKYLNLT